MTYVTTEAEIADGKVVPTEGAKLPERGSALITLLPEIPHRTNWDTVKGTLGVLRHINLNIGAWQHEVRAEWNKE